MRILEAWQQVWARRMRRNRSKVGLGSGGSGEWWTPSLNHAAAKAPELLSDLQKKKKAISWPFPFIWRFGDDTFVQPRTFKRIYWCSSLGNKIPLKPSVRGEIKDILPKDQLPRNHILNEQCGESKLLRVLEPRRVGLGVHTWSVITLRLCKQIDFLCCSLPLCQSVA